MYLEHRNNKLMRIELSEDNMGGIWDQKKKKRRKPYKIQTDGLQTLYSQTIHLDSLFIPMDKFINFQLSNLKLPISLPEEMNHENK